MKTDNTSAARQRRFREKARANGWVQGTVLVPATELADLQLLSDILRDNPDAEIAIRSRSTKQFRALRLIRRPT